MAVQQDRLVNAMNAIRGIKIPEFPKVVMELDAEIKNAFANTQNVAKIIEQNTTISGEVIRIANLPVMKAKSRINSIREAVNTMGLNNIYNLVVIAAFKKMFSAKGLHREISENSLDVAYCMAFMTEAVQGIASDEAYMLGLFHNVGSLMLASKDEQAYQKVYQAGMTNPVNVIVKEQEVFGTDHTMVGLLVAKKWQLPTFLLNTIMLHHTPQVAKVKDDRVRTYIAMLKVANALVVETSLGAYMGSEMRSYLQDGKDELMLDEEFINDLRQQLITSTGK